MHIKSTELRYVCEILVEVEVEHTLNKITEINSH